MSQSKVDAICLNNPFIGNIFLGNHTELLRRIKEASINETIHKIAYDLQQLKATYQQSLEQASADPLANNMETRKYFFAVLEKDMKTMNKMLNNRSSKLIVLI